MKAFEMGKAWRFWVPLLIQTILIIVVPLQSALIFATGQTLTLQTVPVDPYDFLRGYSQTLRYDISNPTILEALPGGLDLSADDTIDSIYVILESPAIVTTPPTPWKPIRVSRNRPKSLPPNQVLLKGKKSTRWVNYGLETYYMPEDQRETLNETIREIQTSSEQAFVVTIKVDDRGNSIPLSLWLGDREYRF